MPDRRGARGRDQQQAGKQHDESQHDRQALI
jgi:hypothetical protein